MDYHAAAPLYLFVRVMLIQLRKPKTDGSRPTLSITRPDGTITWSKVHDAIPVHDLVHYAVESTLSLRLSFFGLLAAGWNLTDFDKPWPRGPLPDEAGWTECVVGFIWQAHLSGDPLTAGKLNADLAVLFRQRGVPLGRTLTPPELDAIQERLNQLILDYNKIPPGGSLDLRFDPTHELTGVKS